MQNERPTETVYVGLRVDLRGADVCTVVDEMNTCNKDGCCTHLAERIVDGGKGFKALHTVNRDSNVTRFLGVSYKTNAKDNGLLLNWCPFCGGRPGYFERTEDMPPNLFTRRRNAN